MSKLLLRNGIQISFQEWGKEYSRKSLALHGWLDNSNTFSSVAPTIAKLGIHCIAIDLVGHGHSSHLSKDAGYSIPSYLYVIRDVLNTLGWEKTNIIGHSMGANLSMLFSGAYPELIEKLVMIEGFGPPTYESKTSMNVLRNAIDSEMKANFNVISNPKDSKKYNTLGDAINSRMKNVAKFPGEQTLSYEAAKLLVTRGSYLSEQPDTTYTSLADTEGPVSFRHDRRLLLPSYTYLNHEQVMSYVDNISCKSLFVQAEYGWPATGKQLEDAMHRKNLLTKKGLLDVVFLPKTSHHLHLDPDSSEEVANIVANFLQQPN